MSEPANHLYEFGPFRLDPLKRVLLREGAPVPLPPKVFDTLLVLVENRGRVLDKDELMNTLWPDTIVEEGNLKVNISHLRKALGESATSHQYIVTIPGRGYRFVAAVTEVWENGVELVLERESSGRIVIEENNTEDREWRIEDDSPSRSSILDSRFSILGFVLLIGLAAAVVYLWSLRPSKPSAPPLAVKSIAVLPFKPLRAEESEAYLGLGMADTLITKLSRIRQLIVRPTGAMLKYAGPEQDPLTAGREQQVDAVLEGTIQRSGEQIRVRVRLLHVQDGAPLWAFECDEHQCADLFALQDSISQQVVQALMLKLTGQEREQLVKPYTVNREAYEAYLKGRYFLNVRPANSIEKALEYFQRAIELDPNYALAYAGVADYYALRIWSGLPPMESLEKAKEAAAKALELDDTLAEAHAVMASVYGNHWDWPKSLRESERAVELNPSSAGVHQGYAYTLIQMGRADEAVAEMKRAQELDPLNVTISANLGEILLYARRYDEAIDALKKALEMAPNLGYAHYDLALAYEQRKRYDEAIAEHVKVEAIKGSSPPVRAACQEAYVASGIRGFWQKKLQTRLDESERSNVSPVYIATIYAHLGQKDQAFEWLEKAYDEHSPHLTDLKANPLFDPLHSDPRFADLLRRIGLAP
ncbi:MAG: tetratricopeptide repeat protein [Acidobacteria bacterium]|nr:tetratricopeptide repeat protein [Acidobacteriota bacterium]